MNHDVVDCVEGDETILTVDIPDDTLERAAGSSSSGRRARVQECRSDRQPETALRQ